MSNKMVALVKIFLLSVVAFGQPAFSETYTRKEAVPAEFFGWIIHRAHTVTPWPTVPFGSWRLWDSYAKWSDIESEPGIFNFDTLDKQVALGAARNKELTYTFGQTPRWASSQPDSKHAWGLGAGSMPKDLEVWRRYVEATSSRYKGRIAFYEVWNEPKYTDSTGTCRGAIFFCGTPEQLVELTRIASVALRKNDPRARLSSPGFTDGLRGVERLDQYLSAGASKYLDAISFHLYAGQPEEGWAIISALREVLRKHGMSNVPLLNTEIGYLIQNEDNDVKGEKSVGGPFSQVHLPQAGAAYLARAMLVSTSGGIDRFFWYAWDSKRMGAIGSKSGMPNEVADAYATVQRWLVSSKVTCDFDIKRPTWICKLAREGRTATVRFQSGAFEQKPTDSMARSVMGGDVEFASNDGRAW